MRKILLYSALLIAGLTISQLGPRLAPSLWQGLTPAIKLATMFCLSFIMIRVGLEFTIDKSNVRQYVWDYVVAATAAAFPWLFCAGYFIWAMSPPEMSTSWEAWKQSLLIGRFAAPTSAGILFSMLAAAGLTATWVFRKARILAIFDDLDTILLMIPLKILMVGMKWQLGALAVVIFILLWIAWKYLHSLPWPAGWRWTLVYAGAITILCELVYLGSVWIDDVVPVHLEVLLPAFVLGCIIAGHSDENNPAENRAATWVTSLFLVLVGLSMPPLMESTAQTEQGAGLLTTVIGGEWPGWGMILWHVLMISLLSNLGKMFSLFCYRREASWKERLAVSIGMWPRGEVGAGVLVVSLSYGLGGPAVTVAMLSLALNLVCTGLFIAAVKALIADVPQRA